MAILTMVTSFFFNISIFIFQNPMHCHTHQQVSIDNFEFSLIMFYLFIYLFKIKLVEPLLSMQINSVVQDIDQPATNQFVPFGVLFNKHQPEEKLCGPYGGPHYLFTIPVKDFYLVKIAKSVFRFYLKLQNFKQVEVFYWNSGSHYLSIMRTL